MKLHEAAGASQLKNFSLKDLTKEDLEQAMTNGGYSDMHLEKSKFDHMNTGSDRGSHLAVYLVTYKDDGSFNSDKERIDQRLYVMIDTKTGKICADF